MKLAVNISWALVLIALVDILLLYFGLQFLSAPKAYYLARRHNVFLQYQGQIMILAAVLLAWFHAYVEAKILWLVQEVYRLFSALLVVGVLGIEGLMHMLSIPHMEGWWVAAAGSSAVFGVIGSWFQKWKKK
jgi:hypothetical protein